MLEFSQRRDIFRLGVKVIVSGTVLLLVVEDLDLGFIVDIVFNVTRKTAARVADATWLFKGRGG